MYVKEIAFHPSVCSQIHRRAMEAILTWWKRRALFVQFMTKSLWTRQFCDTTSQGALTEYYWTVFDRRFWGCLKSGSCIIMLYQNHIASTMDKTLGLLPSDIRWHNIKGKVFHIHFFLASTTDYYWAKFDRRFEDVLSQVLHHHSLPKSHCINNG